LVSEAQKQKTDFVCSFATRLRSSHAPCIKLAQPLALSCSDPAALLLQYFMTLVWYGNLREVDLQPIAAQVWCGWKSGLCAQRTKTMDKVGNNRISHLAL
jgi:hypothetical protein